jgi:hypothetical protein
LDREEEKEDGEPEVLVGRGVEGFEENDHDTSHENNISNDQDEDIVLRTIPPGFHKKGFDKDTSNINSVLINLITTLQIFCLNSFSLGLYRLRV